MWPSHQRYGSEAGEEDCIVPLNIFVEAAEIRIWVYQYWDQKFTLSEKYSNGWNDCKIIESQHHIRRLFTCQAFNMDQPWEPYSTSHLLKTQTKWWKLRKTHRAIPSNICYTCHNRWFKRSIFGELDECLSRRKCKSSYDKDLYGIRFSTTIEDICH